MKFLKLFLIEIGIFLWFIGWYQFGCSIENFWLRLIPNYIAILPVHIFLYDGLYNKIYKEKQKQPFVNIILHSFIRNPLTTMDFFAILLYVNKKQRGNNGCQNIHD